MADLDRVRKALVLLSDDPEEASGQALAAHDHSVPGAPSAEVDTGEADTAPLPVILDNPTPAPLPEPAEAPRGPFEPARPRRQAEPGGSVSADSATPSAGAAAPRQASSAAAEAEPASPEAAEDLSPAAEEKLTQIRDLALMAEVIGDDNLDAHFERVSKRQQELIREFFEQANPGQDAET